MIFGITGYKRHGKDTLAKAIKAIDPHYVIMHFAGHLKNLCITIFGVTYEQMWEDDHKDASITPIVMDDYLEAMREHTGLKVLPRGLVATSPRLLMQYFGTEYIRSVSNRYWIDELDRQVKSKGKVLLPDTRFENEATWIRSRGGEIIRVIRVEKLTASDVHASEAGVMQMKVSHELRLKEGDFDALKNFAFKLINGYEL